MFKVLFVILMSSIIYSCRTRVGEYIYEQERYHLFADSYNSVDTLVLSNYVIQGLRDQSGKENWSPIQLNSDSLFEIVKTSLNDINISINYKPPNINRANSEFANNPYLFHKKINKQTIIDLSLNQNQFTLIPIIYLRHNSAIYHSSAGSSRTHLVHLEIAFFIVYQKNIVYFKQLRYIEETDENDELNKLQEHNIPIPQEHWDGLVREVMKEYIERLK